MPKTDTLAPAGVGIRNASPVVHPRSGSKGVYTPILNGGHCIMRMVKHYSDLEDEYRPCPGFSASTNEDTDWRLDLSDPTAQMHAVWWIAERLGLNEPTNALFQRTGAHTWTLTTARPRGVFPASGPPMSSYNTRFTDAIPDNLAHLMQRPGMAALWLVVPALRDIDPDDRAGAITAIMWHLVEAPCGKCGK